MSSKSLKQQRRKQKRTQRKPPRIVEGDDRQFRLKDDAVFLPEGYSQEEMADQLADPESRVRCAIDDLAITGAVGIEDPALANWTYVLSTLANMSTRGMHAEIENAQRNQPAIKRLARELGAARVIDIPGNVYGQIFHDVDVYTCTEIGGLPWAPPSSSRSSEAFIDASIEAQKKICIAHESLTYPERLPFERTYFAFSSPAPIINSAAASYLYRIAKLDETDRAMGREIDDAPSVMRLLGYLVCANGIACEFIELTRNDSEYGEPGTLSAIIPFEVHWPASDPGSDLDIAISWDRTADLSSPARYAARWSNEYLLNGWVIRALVDLVNNYRSISVTEHSLGYLDRRHVTKRMRKHGVRAVPKPFYRMRLKTSVTHKSWSETRERLDNERVTESRSMTYRHDVRGHERAYVERGAKPIGKELRDKLTGRGYRIYFDAVDASDLIRMSARSVRDKAPDEWIAIKHTWVPSHVSPKNDALPYVPSIHEVPRGKVGENLG